MSSTTNGASGASTPPSTSSINANASRTQPKMTSVGGKALETQRKLATSPMDPTSRKPNVPNAWAKGSTNPVTQRPAGTTVANGVTNNQNRSGSIQKSPSDVLKESNTPDRHANDRITYLWANFIGLHATLTLRSGEKYTGIFSSATHEQSDAKYTLKMVKKMASSDKEVNGATDASESYCGTGQEHVMTFPARDVIDLHVPNVRLEKTKGRGVQNGASRFKTDTDISAHFAARERDLQRWDGGLESDVNMSLDGPANGQPWDQFEANERLYGLKTNYDESFYTTTIDKSHPEYKQRAARAEQLAREIEGSSTLNSHVAEERGQKIADDKGEDEEDKYSGVRRDLAPLQSGQSNKYTPPARRAPSAQTTVPGAPVDPAIISSSLAKPIASDAPLLKENETPSKAAPVTPTDKSSKTDLPKGESSKSATTKPTLPASRLSPGKEGSATSTVEKDVVNAFKQFTATEKLKAQEHQRSLLKRDKAVKLNDLKKFAQNFKLHTEVPQDLIPILAKDKGKQEAIIQKALKNAHEFKDTPPKPQETVPVTAPHAAAAAQPPTKPVASRSSDGQAIQPVAQPEQRPNQRARQSQSNFPQASRDNSGRANNQAGPSRQNNHTTRLQQQYPRQSMPPLPHPLHDPRLPPTGPAMSSGVQSPPGRPQQYNLKAPEFRPNPSAHTFQPGTNNSSGSSPVRVSPTKPALPKAGSFFAQRREALSAKAHKSPTDGYNPVTRALKENESAGKTRDFAQNGGIPQAYRTPPTWEVLDANKEVKYTQVFEKEKIPSISHNMLPHHPMPHQHQLPMHLQSGPIQQGHTPQHTPRHAPVQPHMNPNGHPHYDEHHRMQFSASTSSMHPSPRAGMPYVYNGQGGQPVQVHGQPMPGYGMTPGGYPMTMRQVSGGPQYMTQAAPQMGGHVMTNQSSSGPYMNVQMNSQGPMFTQGPNQGYPHHNGPVPPQASGAGFPSPRPPAPMMAHQGSQQGHHPQMMYMPQGPHGPGMYGQAPTGPMRNPYPPQPHYGSSPHQPHHFPQPHRTTPSASYVQPMMAAHGMPQNMALNNGLQISNEGAEDVK